MGEGIIVTAPCIDTGGSELLGLTYAPVGTAHAMLVAARGGHAQTARAGCEYATGSATRSDGAPGAECCTKPQSSESECGDAVRDDARDRTGDGASAASAESPAA